MIFGKCILQIKTNKQTRNPGTELAVGNSNIRVGNERQQLKK